MGLVGTISNVRDMHVVGEASSFTELVSGGAYRGADVVVVDSDVMQGAIGHDTYAQLNEWLPALKVLFLGSREQARSISPDDLPAYMALNTVGFLMKDGPTSRLVEAIRLINAGTFVCETELIRHILTRLTQWATYTDDGRTGQQLSDREVEVLTMVARGGSNKEIARELFLSEGTIKAHVSHVMTKLNVERRTDLVRYALSKGLIPLSEENGDSRLRG
jgi:two-component system response regulator NreC